MNLKIHEETYLYPVTSAGYFSGNGTKPFEQYERFLTEPRTYVCYRPDGKLKIDGKLNESSWNKAASTAPFVDISGEGFPTPNYETTAKMLWDDEFYM